MASIPDNYRKVLERIERAAVRANRSPTSIRLIGVTKTVDVDRIRRAIDCGLRDIGENRVQEAEAKRPALAGFGVRWHLIGRLQSNKAARAVALFQSIQSVASEALALRLDRLAAAELPVFIQVNVGGEATKAGVAPDEAEALARAVRGCSRLRLDGLMTVPPYTPDPEGARPYFRDLRVLGERLGLRELSMGMSHDFEVAIEEGATMVRIGTAIFGERP